MKIQTVICKTAVAALLCLPLMLGGCGPQSADSSLQERNKAVVRKFNKEFVEEGKVSVYDELVSPNFRSYEMNGDLADPKKSFIFFTQVLRPAFPDLKVIIQDQYADGDTVITRKTFQGTQKGTILGVPGTDKMVKFSAIDIIKLQDGKFVEHWVVTDVFGLLQQIKPQQAP